VRGHGKRLQGGGTFKAKGERDDSPLGEHRRRRGKNECRSGISRARGGGGGGGGGVHAFYSLLERRTQKKFTKRDREATSMASKRGGYVVLRESQKGRSGKKKRREKTLNNKNEGHARRSHPDQMAERTRD